MGFPSVKKGNKIGEKAKKPKPGVPLNKETIAKLIAEEDGNLSRVAERLGTTRHSIRRRCDDDPDLLQTLNDARERQIDILEQSCFDRAIETNDATLQIFLLKTQGKHRGYDQSEAQNTAKDIATAAFDYILNKSKNPAERKR